MWPCYSFSCLLWCILPVTQTVEPEICQSLDPFYTRTVKLPFLSKKMLKIMQTYSFQQFFFFCIASVTFASFLSTQKVFKLLTVTLVPLSFLPLHRSHFLVKCLFSLSCPSQPTPHWKQQLLPLLDVSRDSRQTIPCCHLHLGYFFPQASTELSHYPSEPFLSRSLAWHL